MVNSPKIGVKMLKSNRENVIQQSLCQVNLRLVFTMMAKVVIIVVHDYDKVGGNGVTLKGKLWFKSSD